MTDRTVSIFCIGTAHDTSEKYNLLRVLFDRTDTTSALTVSRTEGAQTASQLVSPPVGTISPGAQHHKIVYDGAPNLSDLPGINAAAHYLKNVRDHAEKTVKSITFGANDTLTVNLVGHSRGAANCLMIASALYREGKALGDGRKYRCNLFLVDTVKVTGILSTSGGVPNHETQFIYENVDSLIHVVMEDNTDSLFVLYDIGEKPLGDKSRITNYRIPGKHGTATQCNPWTDKNAKVSDVSTADPSTYTRMWPIGGAALVQALRSLQDWGTRLDSVGSALADDRDRMLFFYLNRIQARNRLAGKNSRYINNVSLSKPGETQKRDPVSKRATKRSTRALEAREKNPFRYHPIFVNQNHHDLAKSELGEDIVAFVMAGMQSGGQKDMSEVGNVSGKALLYKDFFRLLKKNGFTWDKRDNQ